jgi:hypothetical protein
MARSLYKAAWSGKEPLCALCLTPTRERRTQVRLAHGVAVWLCPAHASPEFQRRRAGRDFAHTLGEAWRAAGTLTRRRERALAAHLARVTRRGGTRARPGSYAWPRLRREVEARAARGERPRAIILSLRNRRRTNDRDPEGPSARTLYRWLAEGRWLAPPAPRRPAPRPDGGRPSRRRRSAPPRMPPRDAPQWARRPSGGGERPYRLPARAGATAPSPARIA